MNEINKFLFAFLLSAFLGDSGKSSFTYSACGQFEGIYKFNETEDSGRIYQNKLGKACFPCEMAYRNFMW